MTEIWRGGDSLTRGLGALPTPAQRCLVRAAVGPVDGIADALAEWRTLVDLSGPIDGGSYRLIPIIFHRLQSAGIDDPNRGMFKGVYRRSLVDNARVLDAAPPVLRALDAAGITPWLTKGAGLVQAGYYPTPATRPMADVDVVVDSARRNDAIEALARIGYRPRLSARERASVHASTFDGPAGAQLDLHWHFLFHARSPQADEIITRSSQAAELGGVPVRVPGPAGLLMINAVHGLFSNPEPPVRWLVDASMILDRDGDVVVWDDVVEFATRFRLARRIEAALVLLAETTGRTAPASTMEALAAVPTYTIERLERRIAIAPWNSVEGTFVQLIAGYAGGDRELRHLATRLPRYLSQRWNVEHVYQFPAVGGRKLRNWLQPGRS